jgi:predicted Zn-dependent protease
MQYMRRAGVSLQGMADVLEIFSGQESLLPARQDTYLRSHPLSRERLRQARSNAATQSSSKPDLSAEYWHARAKAKLAAFLRPPSTILAREQRKLPKDLKAISKAIALSRQGKLSKALDQLRIAQSVRPKDPYYQDLYAELLMRNQKFSAAVTAYEKAVAMAPKDSLILAGYGRTLLANNQISAALKTLENARSRDFRSTKLLRDLAVAYARSDKPEMAALVTAERFALQGRLKDANIHAKRAVLGLPTGSPAWQKAQDILSISTK